MWITLLVFIFISLNTIAYADITSLDITPNKANFSAEDDFMSYHVGDTSVTAGHYQRYAQGISLKEKELGFEYFAGRVYDYPEEEKRNLFSKPKAKYLSNYYYVVADNSDDDGLHYFYIDDTDKTNKRESLIFGTRFVGGEFTTSLGSEFDKNTKALIGSSVYNKYEHKRLRIENYLSTVNSEIQQKRELLIRQNISVKGIKSDIYTAFNEKTKATYQLSSFLKIFGFNIRHSIYKSDKLQSTLAIDKYFDLSDLSNSVSIYYRTDGGASISASVEKDIDSPDDNPMSLSLYTNVSRQNKHIQSSFYFSVSDNVRLFTMSYEDKALTLGAGVRIFKISNQAGYFTVNYQNKKILFGISI